MFIIMIDQDDYFQHRGGFDWGRADASQATLYSYEHQAEQAIIRYGLASYGAVVVSV